MDDNVFQALAHPVRRQIMDIVLANPGCVSGDISEQFDSSRITICKHVQCLALANLIIVEKDGRLRRHYFNPMPIQDIYDRWTDQYSQFFSHKISTFKQSIEKGEAGYEHATKTNI